MFLNIGPSQQKTVFDEFLPSEEEPSLGGLSEQNIKDGHWSEPEIFKFVAFLVYNRQTLKLKLQRRTSKVFKQMSEFVGTRTSVQCRSQNQRLFRKFKNLRSIISIFKSEYGKERFQREYKQISRTSSGIKFRTELQNLLETQGKKTADMQTQTQTTVSEPLYPQPLRREQLFFDNQFGWPNQWVNMTNMANLMMVPYYG